LSRFNPRLLELFILLALFAFPPPIPPALGRVKPVSAYTSTNSPATLPDSSPDFSITATPSAVNLTNATYALVNLTVTSLNGFQGKVYLSTDSFPGGGLFVFWWHTGMVVTLSPGQSANATLAINTPSDPSLLFHGERIIWVSAGAFPCLNHIVTVPITVGPLPTYDFTLTADPTSLTFPAGDYLHYSTITVSSVNSFNGTVSFQWLGGVLASENVTLHPGEIESAQLSFSMSTTTCTGIYSSMVIGTGGAVSHAVVITERLIDPSVSTIYFYASGYCCRPQNSTFTVEVRVNIPTGQAINAFDVEINYTNPLTPFSQGVVQVENLNYTGSLFQQGLVIARCIDGQPQIVSLGCSPGDSPGPGQIHLSMALLGTEIAGPVDGALFSFKFRVTGNGTSTFIFDRALLTSPRLNHSNPSLPELSYLPVLEKMAAFSNMGVVTLLDYQPSYPQGSPALRVNQPVIFSAAGSFSANNPYLMIQSYSWNFGDGTETNTKMAITDHTYLYPGRYAVSLKIDDSAGDTGELVREVVVSRDLGNLTLTVRDQSGTIQAGNVRVALYNASLLTSPVSVRNIDQYGRVEFDDLKPGTYIATFTGPSIVTSYSNETIFPGWSTQITVFVPLSVPPIVTITSVTPNRDTGTTVTLNFTITSPTMIWAISVDWGDGTFSRPNPTARSDTHIYRATSNLESQTFTINGTATNIAGQGFATVPKAILDRPPELTLNNLSPARADIGQTVTIAFSAVDPDGTVSSITVNWGDGSSPDVLSAQATSDAHAYTQAGSYTIIITAADNSGSASHVTSSPLDVSSPLSPPSAATQAPTILGLARTELYALVGLILIVITAAVLLSFREKKGSDTPDSKPS